MKFSEKEIVKGFKEKDRAILNYIYEEYLPSIRYHIINNSGKASDAMEIFQSSMVITYDKIRKKDFRLKCALKTFLQSISRNLWLKELRQRRRNPTYTLDAFDEVNIAYDEGSEEVKKEEIKAYLYQKHFLSLDKECKEILKMQRNNHDINTITETMGYSSEQQCRKKRYRCLQKLMHLIMNDPEFQKLREDDD